MNGHFELTNPTDTLIMEISLPEIKQPSLALTYAMALCCSAKTDWRAVNQAIIARWSFSGLERVKKLAWKRVESRKLHA